MNPDERRRLEASSWLAVVRAYQECNRRYAQMLDHFELTIAQFDALAAIARHEPEATPKSIADELLVTRGNVTGLLNRLRDRGLISTRRNEQDGRSFHCQLTAEGRRKLDAARSATSRYIKAQLAVFDSAELALTETMMRRMEVHLHSLDPHLLASGNDADDSTKRTTA
jgi:DNA-binding MarR family transcriptional regulator